MQLFKSLSTRGDKQWRCQASSLKSFYLREEYIRLPNVMLCQSNEEIGRSTCCHFLFPTHVSVPYCHFSLILLETGINRPNH